MSDMYIENLNNLTIYGNGRHRYFGLLLSIGVHSTKTSVLSAFSFSLFCDIHVYMSVRQPSSIATPC